MTDNEIRQILIERKKAARREERREELHDYIEAFAGFGSLLIICFMLSVIGG